MPLLAPPGLDELEPALPDELALLDPELPLFELGELAPLAPPEGGEEAPELEGEEGGVGSEGVVGVLAEGQPIQYQHHAHDCARRQWAQQGRCITVQKGSSFHQGCSAIASVPAGFKSNDHTIIPVSTALPSS